MVFKNDLQREWLWNMCESIRLNTLYYSDLNNHRFVRNSGNSGYYGRIFDLFRWNGGKNEV